MSNLLLLWGVISHDIGLFTLMFVYWSENVIVGIFNILKMLMAREGVASYIPHMNNGTKAVKMILGRWPKIMFFVVHYGIFTLVHGVFVFVMFSQYGINFFAVLYGVIAVFVSHAISYMVNFVGSKECEMTTVEQLFHAPYKRVIILHITIIFGGIILMKFHNPISLMALFVIFKTLVDLISHMKEHKTQKTVLAL